MTTSRLQRSTHARYRTLDSVIDFCRKHDIPHHRHFKSRTLPSEELLQNFNINYGLTPFPERDLPEKGASSILLFESRGGLTNNHGEVEGIIARKVGHSLEPSVDALYIEASLNPHYRRFVEPGRVDEHAIRELIENQGVPVLLTSIGWGDINLHFDSTRDQAYHFWRSTAFMVDAAGNEGMLDPNYKEPKPFQKHNALSHFSPLVVHVGACATDTDQPGSSWSVEGYSSANGPTFLAPVAKRTNIMWNNERPEAIIGTSAAAPYAAGVLAALNSRYGAYLSREQILYAVIATCNPVTKVSAYTDNKGVKTAEDHDLVYNKNAAGLAFDPTYGGFGCIRPARAEKLLAHMVAMARDNPEGVSEPQEHFLTLAGDACKAEKAKDGLYHYTVTMPPGIALKTTIELDYEDPAEHGDITLTSPSGTTVPMVMSKLEKKITHYALSTTHGFTGEKLEGSWEITSTTPLTRLGLHQHHMQERDLVKDLNVAELADAPQPDLTGAKPYRLDYSVHRVLHTRTLPESGEPHGLLIGGKKPVEGDVHALVGQLQELGSGFTERHRKPQPPILSFDKSSAGGKLEAEAMRLAEALPTCADRIAQHEKIAGIDIAAADAYAREASRYSDANVKQQKTLLQLMPLRNAGFNYLQASHIANKQGKDHELAAEYAEKAVAVYRRALRVSKDEGVYHQPFPILCDLYTAVCRCCELGMESKYGLMLEGMKHEALQLSREAQGIVDMHAHRIEEGEYGFSAHDKIGTDNVSQCITVIARDPVTCKTGIAHIDIEANIESLDKFFHAFEDDDPLEVRLVGARFDQDAASLKNLDRVMKYLSKKNVDIISADIYGGNEGPSTLVVDPLTFTMEEAVPGKHNDNENASNVIIMVHKEGKPLVQQFDLTHNTARAPIHLNSRMLSELRQKYLHKKEWQVEANMHANALHDRPLLMEHLHRFEHLYDQQWKIFTDALRDQVKKHGISDSDALKALVALGKQSFYVGANAETANKPLMDWIRNDLFKDGQLQFSALEPGPTAQANIYDPEIPASHEGRVRDAEKLSLTK